MINFADRTIVVSGAGAGIGRGLAIKAAERGARVAVIDVRADAAAATVQYVTAAGGRAIGYAVDVTDLEAMRTLAGRIEAEFGSINMVFNNAGVITRGTIMDTKPDDLAWVFDVNVRGLYNAIHAFMPGLKRAATAGNLAYIVTTGSENSIALPTLGPFTVYTGSKHAVLGITEGLRRDLQGSGIEVSIICPGLVQTELWNSDQARPERFGGPHFAEPEVAARMAKGRTVQATVDTAFAGLDAGEFMIITDPRMRDFTTVRIDQLARALDTADARVVEL